ncbi:MAG: HlyD family secretion protein [Bacteroidota bacterium]|jgi:multidrug resistance efflux pump
MKFNILYLLFPAALAVCFWIASDFQYQSVNSFFGIAETEPRSLNFDHDIAVREVFVKTGDLVKKGDTLATFYRAELDEQSLENWSELRLTETERATEFSILEKEKELVRTRLSADARELQAEISLLITEDSLNTLFRGSVYSDLKPAGNKMVADKIAARRKQIDDLQKNAAEEIRILESKQAALGAVASVRNESTRAAQKQLESEKNRLFLISPIDGYVETVLVARNALVEAFTELMKINPQAPNTVIGFIHEASNAPLAVGQEVELVSFNRPEVKCSGRITSINPKMTELPLRLRKFIEMRSWGREVFIGLPQDNRFYISEKITINLPAH